MTNNFAWNILILILSVLSVVQIVVLLALPNLATNNIFLGLDYMVCVIF